MVLYFYFGGAPLAQEGICMVTSFVELALNHSRGHIRKKKGNTYLLPPRHGVKFQAVLFLFFKKMALKLPLSE